MFWLTGWTGDRKDDLKVRVISSSPWAATETVAVTSMAPATVVRSVADIPGWRTSLRHGRARDGYVAPRRARAVLRSA